MWAARISRFAAFPNDPDGWRPGMSRLCVDAEVGRLCDRCLSFVNALRAGAKIGHRNLGINAPELKCARKTPLRQVRNGCFRQSFIREFW